MLNRLETGSTGLAAALALALLLTVAVRADDWPQWRGPNRNGVWIEAAVPAGGLARRWSVPVGVGFSSPIVVQGRVYVSDSQPVRPTARERVQCLDAATGKSIWSHAYDVNYPDWAFDEPNQLGPVATPIVVDGRVYTLGVNGRLLCLGATKGELHWQKDLQKEYPAKELKCHASPLIDGDRLILFVGAKPGACVIAFDKNTGKEVWRALHESATSSSPIILEFGGARQLIVWTQESVTALDPATGKTYWQQRLVTSADFVVSTPVWQKDLLLLGGLMMRLDADKPAASVLWPETRVVSRRILSHTSTAFIRGDRVFSARSSGELVCLEARTGKQLWETDQVTDLKNGASIHITAHGDTALLYNERGELIQAHLTPSGYRELGRALLLQPTYPFSGRRCAWAPPAFAQGHVFARSDEELVCTSLAARE